MYIILRIETLQLQMTIYKYIHFWKEAKKVLITCNEILPDEIFILFSDFANSFLAKPHVPGNKKTLF